MTSVVCRLAAAGTTRSGDDRATSMLAIIKGQPTIGEVKMTVFKGCPGAINVREARPEPTVCPVCGGEAELWSDERAGRCHHCGSELKREMGPSCYQWCKFAADCIGEEKLAKLKGSGERS
jgi:hypothetical protein